MKKLGFLLLFLAFASMSFGQGITGTAHDFSGSAWNATGEMCVVCHTPHNAYAVEPLWNHEQTVVAAYTLYTSNTFDATIGQPSAESKLCLGCHDGTVALENFGTTTGSSTNYVAAPFGTDLTNDHPVSITYNTALATADGGLYDPSVANSGLGSTIDADMLFAGQMQCSSCHDVHDAYNQSSLLVMSNAGSALCLTCHNK